MCLASFTHAQLSVSSHDLTGSFAATAPVGSTSGDLSRSDPTGYLAVISEAALVNATGTESANFFGVLQSDTIEDGFRVAGFVDADRPVVPFYEQSHDLFASVTFELAQSTPIRIAGDLAHNPSTSADLIALLNGTSFSLRDADSGALPFEASVSPIGGSSSLAIDEVIVLPAGRYVADLTSFSRMGAPLSPGLLDVKVSWDVSVTVVPASPTLAAAPLGLLALRRRR